MGAYNLIKGEHCCQSKYLLEDILRKEWEYDGVVISDWGAVHDTDLAANSELDVEMSVTDDFDRYFMADPLKQKIESGEISESVVLLKNQTGKLPLSVKETKKLLVIGENAECTHANGGGSAEIKALYEITPLMGIKTLLGGNAEVRFVPGYCRDEKKEESDANWQETSLVEMGAWIDKADTVVWSWYAGCEGGRALAEVLFGKVTPSGKLPETFYKKHTDCSAHAVGEFPGDKKVRYTEGVFVGYRYNDTFEVEPQFCFGHGLSYTEFAYENPRIVTEDGNTVVKCEVTNTGSCCGKETVQVYLAPKNRKENQPMQELKGFEKITLEPSEKKTVSVIVEDMREGMEIRIGSSSRDIRLTI